MDPRMREGETFVDDYSAKKKFNFKSFKKFFGKKKRKETLPSLGASGLKQSQSASDVTGPDSLHPEYDSEDDIEATSGVLGSRAVSHDSIFIPEVAQETTRPIRVFSQENVSDRIKALQLKLQSNIKVGPPPFGLLNKRSEDAGASSEDDGLPRSPPEMSLLQDAIKTRFSDIHRHHHSSLSLAGTGSEEDEQISSETPSRPLSPDENELKESNKTSSVKSGTDLLPSADFSTPPQNSTFLDNSAARHRLSVKPKNQRLSKNRRPSAALQEESFKNITYMEEEDVTTSRLEHDTCDPTETPTDNIMDINLEAKEASTELAEVNESPNPLNLPEVAQGRSPHQDLVKTLESENVMASISGSVNIELEEKIKDQSELVSARSNENVSIALPIINTEVFPVSLTKNENLPVKESKTSGYGDVHVKSTAVEKAVHSSRTTSLGQSQESLQNRRSVFQNTRSEKCLNYQDQPLSDKENHKQLGNGDKTAEKTPTETVTQRKFSVSSAWERPRTGSFSVKPNVESDEQKTTKLSLQKPAMSKKNILKEEHKFVASNITNKSISSKTESVPDPEDTPADKAVFSNSNPNPGTVPAASDLPLLTESQANSEDRNPFFVKLRSTSLSLRYRDCINPVSNMIKRHSGEFKQAKTTDLSSSKEALNTEQSENKGGDLRSTSENENCKSESTEVTQAKPPLPKKPVLQNITVADNNTNKETSESSSYQEKIEKKVPDGRQGLRKATDKNTPERTAEHTKAPENKTELSWISVARQKHRSLKEDRSVFEHSLKNQDSEKLNKDRAEACPKQQIDSILTKTTNSSVSVLPETYGQDTKAEKSEQRQRANTLPHPVHATQLSLLTEKEEKNPQTRQIFSVSQEPSWMELAKKKSQAWSDKPQIIK
ncbi:hypothetical protein GDO81_005487 [Engystomops pustulosus]|uniref:DUF4592 domain-containing protein n=1 Tax=Engystomops pustulosus TaxID=76066 RepID=A0AAV7CP19_ENGPU|nr:hypothetical protein GDO81_005487 [Engystomops pustulosus]